MLPERAAGVPDVEELHATTDGEHGQVFGERVIQERYFERVAIVFWRLRARVGRLAVELRVEVGPAGQNETGEAVERCDGIRRRDKLRLQTGRADRVGIRRG